MDIEMQEIVAVMQELFPREYTICLQRVTIAKLEAMIEAQAANGEKAD